MRLTVALWLLVLVVYAAAGVLLIVHPQAKGEADAPIIPTTNPPPAPPPSLPPQRDSLGSVPNADSITISGFTFDRSTRVIDITFLVRGMQRRATIDLPSLTYNCTPSDSMDITVSGLQSLFDEAGMDVSVDVSDEQLAAINAQRTGDRVCTPTIDQKELSAVYIYGIREDIVTMSKGAIVDDLTFHGIKDLSFRGPTVQDTLSLTNQLAVPLSLQSGKYSMNITVVDKLTGDQDSVIKEFEI